MIFPVRHCRFSVHLALIAVIAGPARICPVRKKKGSQEKGRIRTRTLLEYRRGSSTIPQGLRDAVMTMSPTKKSQTVPLLCYLAIVVGIAINLLYLSFIEATYSTLEGGGESIHRTVRIINDSGRHVELYRISSKAGEGDSNEEKLMNTLWSGSSEIKLESFVGDVFEIREKSPAATEKEEETSCEQEEQSCQQDDQRKVVATLTVREDDVTEQSKLYIYLTLN